MKLTPARFVLQYAKKHLKWIVLLGVLSCVSALAMVGMAVASSRVIDLALTEPRGFTRWFVILLALLALLAVCNILYSNIRVRAVGRMKNEMRRSLFDDLMAKDYQKVAAVHSGEILNRFTSDIQIVVEGAVTLIPQVISLGTKLVAGLTVMLFIDPLFTGIVLVGGMLIAACVHFFSRFYKKLHKDCQQTEGRTRAYLQECVENLMVIKSFVNERGVGKKLDDYQEDNYRVQIRRNFFSNIGNTVIYVGFTIGYYGALAWGALRIAWGGMSVGTFTAFLQIIEQIRSPFRNVSGLMPQYYSMMASAERLQELTLLPDEDTSTHELPLDTIYEQTDGIVLDQVTFRYAKETVLQNTSAFFEKGKMTVMIGQSGAGKSTVVKLLLGLTKPEQGVVALKTASDTILLDASTRGLFAFVPQGNMILSGTIADNIAFFRDDAPREDIECAARQACLWEAIEAMPDGLDTVIGERGIGLSEGQIQRVAIARALLSDAPILLLDECTSALDSQTEKQLLENLHAIQDRTILFISHKRAVLETADHVVSVEDGKICTV
ncbi:MAG: ABC transporter ATP-binding protein [Acutalibacteraceae bacterium]